MKPATAERGSLTRPAAVSGKKRGVKRPWDLLRGLDVFTDSRLLNNELSDSFAAHWAPNCSSFSRAREKPIPGVANPPRPLRSDAYPRGIPSVLVKLPRAKRRKLEADTQMAEMAADDCLSRISKGKLFSLEHPKNSIARELPSWKALESHESVFVTEYHACMYKGCERRKSQVLIHNVKQLRRLARICARESLCSRTAKRHLGWKPVVVKGRIASFATGEEREYPEGFCREYAAAMREALRERDEPSTFIEIFSGPNAPLSHAVAEELGTTVPGALEGHVGSSAFDKKEASTLQELVREKTKLIPSQLECGEFQPPDIISTEINQEIPKETGQVVTPAELGGNRLHALESGKQPSYGKRIQLIPDGDLCPERHFAKAKCLTHPFDGEFSIKRDHVTAMEFIQQDTEDVLAYRLRKLSELREILASNQDGQREENRRASWTARRLGLRVKTSAMRTLQKIHNIEDTHVPDICLEGASILGVASESPFFEEFDIPPKMTSKEYHGDKRERSLDMIKRVERMATLGSPELANSIHEKTQKEVQKGTMEGPYTWEEIDRMFKGDFQVVPSFGLEQGVDESGFPKFRRIDDHTACGNNLVAHRRQKVPMCMVDYVGALVKSLAKTPLAKGIKISTEDMKSAYRQIPLSPHSVRYSVTAVYHPGLKEASLYLMLGQPFGAGHAVPNFCRVAEWMARLMQRRYNSLVDHFFDDFWAVEPESTIESTMFVLRETFQLLGFSLDPEKAQPPASVCAVLGVLFSTASLRTQKYFLVQAKPTRVQHLKDSVSQVLSSGILSPAQAASIVGKFGFLCSTLFGKVGRCCTGPLRTRQYSVQSTRAIDKSLKQSLELMLKFLDFSPSRRITSKYESPIILYTDASDVPHREPQHVVGAVIFDPVTNLLEYSSWNVERRILSHWLPRSNHMGQLELLAAPFAALTWASLLENRSIICFIDNDSAGANLVKGYSKQPDSSALVGEFWLIMASLKANVYIDRVESKSNLADGPSRLDFHLVLALGAQWKEPNTDRLGSPCVNPALWSSTKPSGGKEQDT